MEECQHLTQELRYKTNKVGQRYYVYQCLDCGDSMGRVKSNEALGTEAPFNERLFKARQEERLNQWRLSCEQQMRQRTEEMKLREQKEQEEWFSEYNRYLKSPQWRARRRLVLARDNYTCQACLLAPADEVHHLTYAHVFNEPLFDLISICRTCHEAVTELDRQRRR